MTITGNGELMHIWNDPVIVVSMKEDLCFWVEPMSMKSGIIVLCDRSLDTPANTVTRARMG